MGQEAPPAIKNAALLDEDVIALHHVQAAGVAGVDGRLANGDLAGFADKQADSAGIANDQAAHGDGLTLLDGHQCRVAGDHEIRAIDDG